MQLSYRILTCQNQNSRNIYHLFGPSNGGILWMVINIGGHHTMKKKLDKKHSRAWNETPVRTAVIGKQMTRA